MTITSGLAVALALYWWVLTWKCWSAGVATRPLPPYDSVAGDGSAGDGSAGNGVAGADTRAVRISVVIAARNEQQRIGQTIDRLLAQRHVDLQIVVVDDRSSDATASIVRRKAEEWPEHVLLVSVDRLPSGWLGKCHACWLGASRASADWLLFTDGDIHMVQDVLARAVRTAQRDRADHLTLFPDVLVTQWATRLAITGQSLLFLLYTSPEKINQDRGRRAIGVGAFNLIRRTTYDAIGGHQTLRMEVVDDMKLGTLVRKHGFRQRVYSGLGDVQADWAQSVPGVIQALEKNWFAAAEFRWGVAALFLVGVPVTILAAATGPMWAGPWGVLPLIAWLSLGVPGIRLARDFGWPRLIGWWASLGWLVFVAAGVNSVWKTWRQGGIRWRERFYPLAELRRGVVR